MEKWIKILKKSFEKSQKNLQKFTFVFTVDGVYSYHCEPHPWMQGKVTIIKGEKEKF